MEENLQEKGVSSAFCITSMSVNMLSRLTIPLTFFETSPFAQRGVLYSFATEKSPPNSWPDGGNHPFRADKGVGGYEGGFKVPAMIKWPGVVEPGTTTGELVAMEDWVPTIMSLLGQPSLAEDLLDGAEINGVEYRVHIDGVDQTPVLTGEGPSNRMFFPFFSETTFHGLRFGEWKFLFTEQDKWFNGIQNQLVTPLITRLDLDPFLMFQNVLIVAEANVGGGEILQALKPRNKDVATKFFA